MDWLNYHHLLYFWHVVREGGIAKAARKLRLAHPTVSAQLKALESAFGAELLAREGRHLALTETGEAVFRYADEIFTLGRELQDTVAGRPVGRPVRLVVGIAEVVPKLVARRLIEPARHIPGGVRLSCREDKSERLITELAAHRVDVVLSDSPLPPGGPVRAFNHLLVECGVSVLARADLAARHRDRFPRSLDGAPMLLPSEATSLRRSLDQWFDGAAIRPLTEAEFDDSALLKAFGQDGVGLFVAPTPIEAEVVAQYQVEVVGRLPEVRERYYALSIERRIRHPAVLAIREAARGDPFQGP